MYISQVKRDLQVPPESFSTARVYIKDLQQVVPRDSVQVAVGDGVHVCIGPPWFIIQMDKLAEDVVLFYKRMNVFYLNKDWFCDLFKRSAIKWLNTFT